MLFAPWKTARYIASPCFCPLLPKDSGLLLSFRSEELHAASVLPTNFIKRGADLAQRAGLDGIDQHSKDVAVFNHRLFQLFQHDGCGRRVSCLEITQALDLPLLFFVG